MPQPTTRKFPDALPYLPLHRFKQSEHLYLHADKMEKLNEENSPLLRLPEELRNHIYNYVCGGVTIAGNRYCRDLFNGTTSKYRSVKDLHHIMAVCRKLYVETHLLPFKLNSFYAHDFTLTTVSHELSDIQRDSITDLRIECILMCCEHEGSGKCLCEKLKVFRGLKRVVLYYCPNHDPESQKRRKQTFPQIEETLKERGIQVDLEPSP